MNFSLSIMLILSPSIERRWRLRLLLFRVEFFDLPNHPVLGVPEQMWVPTFGVITRSNSRRNCCVESCKIDKVRKRRL